MIPLIASKGFRYNRRDLVPLEPFQAVSPRDALILKAAKLAHDPAPPDAPALADYGGDDPPAKLEAPATAEPPKKKRVRVRNKPAAQLP